MEKMSLGGNVSGVNASGKSVFWGNDKGPSDVPQLWNRDTIGRVYIVIAPGKSFLPVHPELH